MIEKIQKFIFSALGVGILIGINPLCEAAENIAVEKNAEVPSALISWNKDISLSDYFLLVDKSARQLQVWKFNDTQFIKVKEYPTDLGKSGGVKTKRGDLKTPEGLYFLAKKLEGPQIDFTQYGSLAFVTSYPNVFDRLEDKTGDGIWLHAVPDSVPLTRGSKGCVVLRNDDIKSVESYITLGETPLFIFDKIRGSSTNEKTNLMGSIKSFIVDWKSSWMTKSVDRYLGYYHELFKGQGMNYTQWRKHKSHLAEDYKTIEVEFSEPSILAFNDQYLVRMIQTYKSDKYSDRGVKTLSLLKTESGLKIVSEDWSPLNYNLQTATSTQNNFRSPNSN